MKIRWNRGAYKELEKLENETIARILNKLEQAAKNPSHFLKGLKGVTSHKLRVGDYRIIIDWLRNDETLLVLKVGKRSQIYREDL